MRRAWRVACLVCAAAAAPAARSQAQTVDDLRDLSPTKIGFGGQAELFAEKYSMSGRQARRPSETARLLVRPYVRFGDGFELSANLLLSTEGRDFGADGRQRINRFGLSPSWSWGSAALGDFNLSYTPLTYQGIPVRGAALTLEPGLLRFSALGGQTQRAVAGDATNGTYGRTLYAGRLGVGREGGSYLDLLAVYADDDLGSLGSEPTWTEPDSNEVGDLVEPTSVTPQENLVVGVAAQVSLWQRMVVWQAEFAGAAYTRDKRASATGSLPDIPSWLTGIFTPRVGSNVDYAGTSNLRLRLPKWDLQGGYQYVGPGYRSLGVGSLLVDREVVHGRAAFKGRAFNAALIGRTQHDNVAGQKQDTTRRNAFGATIGLQPRSQLLVTLRGNVSTMVRGADDPDARIDNLNQVWGVGTRVMFRQRLVTSVGLDYRLQRSHDANPARSLANFMSHQLVVPVTFQLATGLELTPHVGLVYLQDPVDGWRLTHTEALALRHRAPNRRLTNTLTVGTSFDDGSRRLFGRLNSAYRLTEQTTLKLVLRSDVLRAGSATTTDWEEFVARLSLETTW